MACGQKSHPRVVKKLIQVNKATKPDLEQAIMFEISAELRPNRMIVSKTRPNLGVFSMMAQQQTGSAFVKLKTLCCSTIVFEHSTEPFDGLDG